MDLQGDVMLWMMAQMTELTIKILVVFFVLEVWCCLPLLISPPQRSAVNADVRRLRFSRAAKPAMGISVLQPSHITGQVSPPLTDDVARLKKEGVRSLRAAGGMSECYFSPTATAALL